MFGVTPFYREPTEESLIDEILAGKEFLHWLRWAFPKIPIIYREGNHEMRLRRYVVTRAEALADLPGMTLQELLELGRHGIEYIQDKRIVRLGRLNTLHGHELPRGGGINPARYAFLKATDTVIVGHWHRTSHHVERSLSGRSISTWSVGCLCELSPDYMPYGQSNHGFALVEVDRSGEFAVQNFRVREGRVE